MAKTKYVRLSVCLGKKFAVNRYISRFLQIIVVGILLVCSIRPSLAQSTGTILGTVKDATGAVVPDAKVTVTDTDTNESRVAATGNDGTFRFPALITGNYAVKVEKSGFKTQTQAGLTLEVTQELVVSITLNIGTSTQVITVTSEVPVVDTTNSALGLTVNESKMEDPPLSRSEIMKISLFYRQALSTTQT